jgi:hypothetical protein
VFEFNGCAHPVYPRVATYMHVHAGGIPPDEAARQLASAPR